MAGLNLLITGKPGVGKTTLVERIVERLRGSLRLAGFTTTEVLNSAGGRQWALKSEQLSLYYFPTYSVCTSRNACVYPRHQLLHIRATLAASFVNRAPSTTRRQICADL
jgi:Cdc6-like AAA superfamily ATPase